MTDIRFTSPAGAGDCCLITVQWPRSFESSAVRSRCCCAARAPTPPRSLAVDVRGGGPGRRRGPRPARPAPRAPRPRAPRAPPRPPAAACRVVCLPACGAACLPACRVACLPACLPACPSVQARRSMLHTSHHTDTHPAHTPCPRCSPYPSKWSSSPPSAERTAKWWLSSSGSCLGWRGQGAGGVLGWVGDAAHDVAGPGTEAPSDTPWSCASLPPTLALSQTVGPAGTCAPWCLEACHAAVAPPPSLCFMVPLPPPLPRLCSCRDLRPLSWKFATGPLPGELPVDQLGTPWFLLSI